MRLTFVYLPSFERSADGLLTDDQMREVENQLLEDPHAGDVVRGTGGVRKLRVAFPGRGKSGSGRIIYAYVSQKARVFFLLAYPKNRLESLTAEQKNQMRQLVKQLEEE